MALDATKNFAKWTVSTWYDDSAVSIVLSSWHWAKFPQPSTDGEFNLVWWDSSNYKDPSDDPKVEIVRCTARSTDTLTVTRAQESTSASTKNTSWATYTIALVLTSKMIDDIDSNKLWNIVEDTTPQLWWNLDLNKKSISFVSIPDDNSWYWSEITFIKAWESVAFPNVAYLKSDWKWWLADADAIATAWLLWLVLESKSADQAVKVLLKWLVRDDDWNWTIWWDVYLSTTAWWLTQTAVSWEDDVVVKVWYAITADVIYFNPDNTRIEYKA